MVAGQHQQVAVVEFDGVDRRAGEVGRPVVADADLRREVFGVDSPHQLALFLFEEMFGRQLSNVADARQALNQNRVLQVGVGDCLDVEFVHVAYSRARSLSARRYSPWGSSGLNGAGALLTASAPQSGHVAERVYTGRGCSSRHAEQTRMSDFIRL